MIFRGVFLTLLLSSFVTSSFALPKDHRLDSSPIAPTLLLEEASEGNSAKIGVHFKIADGWHIYSRSPGDIGLPTTIDWSSNEPVVLVDPEWPTEEAFDYQGISSSGYSGEATVWSTLKATSKTSPPLAHIEARVSWLACKDECIPGEVTLLQDVPLQSMTRVSLTKLSNGAPPATTSVVSALSVEFLLIVWGAFLGGIILNVMPCVFPVLSLKIMGLTMTHDSRGMRIHALAYGAGVLTSFWTLAILLNSMRSFGSTVGWGFQFQHPGFVFSLMLIVFVLSLNMLGLFDYGHGIQKRAGSIKVADGATGAFLSGVLATALATPCTGPFMGSAIAAALSMSNLMTLLVFSSLGAGLALPYMVLCWYPAWRCFLPRPGAWMNLFKQALAIPLSLTVLWLIWILEFQIGVNGISRVVVSLFIVGLACWGLGRLSNPSSSRLRQRLVTLGALVACIGAVLVGTPWSGYVADSSIATASSSSLVWEKFSSERLSTLRATGVPVVVDFTAAWCVVCQVNERRVFAAPDIVDPLVRDGLVFMKADWTKQDPEISSELALHGVVGIPFVVVYGRQEKQATFSSLIEPETFLREARKAIAVQGS